MNATTSFSVHLLSIVTRNDTGEKEIKSIFDLIVSNGGWKNSMIRGKKVVFLKLTNTTNHAVTGPLN